ncbi:aldo/keto reductase [Williamsoniiplasma somnilux]|uniref:Aldo/keto reductase n=1 Tax=Williamsoniiplasma somnilux TaxID=215578 RepID=A0A2K8NXE8_9MOLU|nr:aldo/keto reductase [Williamsoniiplasma somnilux]ATZ18414.1 aldo/keto reductase [Williamsoniiplasma somnilux]
MKDIKNIKIKMNNGTSIPQFGLGTYLMNDEAAAKEAIKYAISIGYKHIDCAFVYRNQKVVGQAIKESGVKREDLFITSKVWIDMTTKADVLKQIDTILEDLETDYLDLCLIHWYTKYSVEMYKGLEEAYKQGKLKAIGVSNFMIEQLEQFLPQVNIVPQMNQFELNPLLRRPELVKYCFDKNIQVTSYQTIMKGKVGEIAEIQDLAKKYSVTPSQVALRWAIQKGIVVIPKSVTQSRLFENQDISKFELTKEDIQLIDKIPTQKNNSLDPYTYGEKYFKEHGIK